MSERHTPGPWHVVAGDNYEVHSPLLPREFPHHFKDDSTGDYVAYIGNHAPDFGKANADLIAAAPNLLAALRLFVQYEQEMEGDDHVAAMLTYAQLHKDARDAIAAAEGREVTR